MISNGGLRTIDSRKLVSFDCIFILFLATGDHETIDITRFNIFLFQPLTQHPFIPHNLLRHTRKLKRISFDPEGVTDVPISQTGAQVFVVNKYLERSADLLTLVPNPCMPTGIFRYIEITSPIFRRCPLGLWVAVASITTPAIFQPLYLAMERPHLDYVVQAWFPYLQKIAS